MSPNVDCHIVQAAERNTRKRFLERYLVSAMQEMLDGYTDGDPTFQAVRRHCSADYEVTTTRYYECPIPGSDNLEASIENIVKIRRENPRWTVNAYNISACVADELDYAVVWFTSAGSADWGSKRESVCKTQWRERPEDGHWECFKHKCIHGFGNLWGLSEFDAIDNS